MPLPPDFVNELRKHFTGDIRNDQASRVLYGTDASIYQIEPLGVVLPRTQDDLQAVVELAAKHRLPILPRGSGTSLAGQAIGEAVVVDCSRWLDKLIDVNPESRTATFEPGVILAKLNAAASKFGLQYGPDPASAERATMGGVIANNATGAHSILYGMTADHLLSADVVMADGSLAQLGEAPAEAPLANRPTPYDNFLDAARRIRAEHADAIYRHYPRSWRNSAGYRLNYLLSWSATQPPRWIGEAYPPSRPGAINLASLLAGSEGTLAVIRRATVQLVHKPKHTVLAILSYESAAAACDAVPEILTHNPSAVELIPRLILQLACLVPGYASQMEWVSGDPAAVLVVEFSGERPDALVDAARQLRKGAALAITPEEQERVWNVRRAGLGILDLRPQSARPAAFIEDCAIPVEHLGEYVREVERILKDHHTEGGIYAHASAGCLHIRPVLDLKSRAGVTSLREIAQRVLALTLRLGGAMASEHGDGIARGEWLRATYGDELIGAMRALKQAADPRGLLNPGKMFDAPPMDTHLRYGIDYQSRPWFPALGFKANGGLVTAIEQCNGQGVCRKDTGVMCPSFQATREEMHSTRGRANLLRSLIRISPAEGWSMASEQAVFEALDLCLACKGCKAECPSGVDMAKLKFEFLSRYYQHHPRRLRDYAFGYFHVTARLASTLAPLVNTVSGIPAARGTMASLLGLTTDRPFPRFVRRPARPKPRPGGQRVLFLREAFTHYVDATVEQAAFDLLWKLGFNVIPLQTVAAGAALLSKGFIEGARKQARAVFEELCRLDPDGVLPLVGVEPSEVYAFRHEYVDLLPEQKEDIAPRAEKAWTLEEFLIRSRASAALRIATNQPQIIFHPHCHQRAEPSAPDGLPTGSASSAELLLLCGYDVQVTEAGCCGMAGTFGYEAEHYGLSQQIADLRLLPQLRSAGNLPIAATGAACRMQIAQAIGAQVEHPIVWANRVQQAAS